MEGLIHMIQKGCESFVHDHGIDFCVIIVRWVDVPDNDQGDFRRRRAVDISSLFFHFWLKSFKISVKQWGNYKRNHG